MPPRCRRSRNGLTAHPLPYTQCSQLSPRGLEVDSIVRAVEVVCVRGETGCTRIDMLDEEEVAIFFA
jgi:hypothetical protein